MAMRIRKINIGTRETANVVALTSLNSTDARCIDVSADGTLYVADAGHHHIIKVYESGRIAGAVVGHTDSSGNVNSTGIATTGNDARVNTPRSICVDNSGNIYCGDGAAGAGYQIRRMSPSGKVSLFAGNAAFLGDTIGDTGSDVRFRSTVGGMGLAVDKAGTVYICDTGNNKIKKIWSSGKCNTLAGHQSAGSTNATGTDARFSAPADCCVDNQGNVYVADTTNNRVRKITESGVVTTLAGTGTASLVNGDGATATFSSPRRICIDPSNQFLYVLDFGNKAVRRVNMHGQTASFCHIQVSATQCDICVDGSGFLYILENSTDA